jgi:methionyl-tRNA formyltransferase
MRIVFAGTPEFAAAALQAILAAGFEVPLVLTQPDRPAGRGMALHASPVKELALKHELAVYQPCSLKGDEASQPIRDVQPDVMVVAAYGLILPQTVLDLPRLGCINIHASLLPRWRGAAPIQRALLAGDAETGVTIMQMEAGLDTGPMLMSGRLPISSEDTAQTLHDKLALQGADLIVAVLRKLEPGGLAAMPQPAEGVTYAAKIGKGEAEIDWRRPAAEVCRAVRAYNPFPGAVAHLDGAALKLWSAEETEGHGEPGSVLAAGKDGIVVACGEGALRLTVLQKPGGKRLPVADFLHGFKVAPGARFVVPGN